MKKSKYNNEQFVRDILGRQDFTIYRKGEESTIASHIFSLLNKASLSECFVTN